MFSNAEAHPPSVDIGAMAVLLETAEGPGWGCGGDGATLLCAGSGAGLLGSGS